MRLRIFAVMALILAFYSTSDANDISLDSKSEDIFLKEYKDYQILPKSTSLDGQYGFIYPSDKTIDRFRVPRLFLAKLIPFKVLTEVGSGVGYLYRRANGYYLADWTKDSSCARFIVGSKWGPEKVFVVAIEGGGIIKKTDLILEVRKIVQPLFKKSGIERYNKNYDFIFESGDHLVVGNNDEIIEEKGWDFRSHGQLEVDCFCTTDPKGINSKSWNLRFTGIWDIFDEKFINYSTAPYSQ